MGSINVIMLGMKSRPGENCVPMARKVLIAICFVTFLLFKTQIQRTFYLRILLLI